MGSGNIKKSVNRLLYVKPEGVRETARIAIVGEAPGVEEEWEGRPFMDRAGQLVRAAIQQSEVSPGQILMVNAVGIRLPDDRTPTRAEILSWTPHLYDHTRYVWTIITLGRNAELAVAGIAYIDQKEIIGIYHPSWTLRKGKEAQGSWVTLLAQLLRGERP